MIDPITALATATSVFKGIKVAVKIGKEAEEIFTQLGKWATAIEDVKEGISQERKKPSIFKKITYKKSATAEAFDELAAKKKVAQMEKDLKHMFYWGELNHLGADGYKKLIHLRRNIKAKREKEVYQQMRKRQALLYYTKWGSIITFSVLLLIYMTYSLINMIMSVNE